MFKNLKVGTKLVAVLVAPIVVLAVLAYIGVSQRTDDADAAARTAELAEFARVTADVVHELQVEAVLSGAYVGAAEAAELPELAWGDADRAESLFARLTEQREKTDAARAAWVDARERIDPGRGAAGVTEELSNLEARLNTFEVSRISVNELQNPNAAAVGRDLRDLQAAYLAVNIEVTKLAAEADLSQFLRSFVAASEVNMYDSEVFTLAVATVELGFFANQLGAPCVISPQGDPIEGTLRVATVEGEQVIQNLPATGTADTTSANRECIFVRDMVNAQTAADSSDFDDVATVDDKQQNRNIESAIPVGEADKLVDRVLASPDELTVPIVNPVTGEVGVVWAEVSEERTNLELDRDESIEAAFGSLEVRRGWEDQLITRVLARAADLQDEAEQDRNLYLLGAFLAIAAAVIVAALVVRATTVPLRKLTTAAYALSTDKLPGLVERLRNPEEEGGESLASTLTAIDIDSRDEVGQLAEAFNSIQQVTVEVAEEQANLLRKGIGDIFINLARRNQTLLDRQIEFIDQLEANEEDPDQLDNLFKLDHLATRMRRNAESLLVLAGAEPPRRRGRPVALADVVRVAIGEVEDFARIQLLALDEATVGGNVAVDLAHLLSELMENATHFSPPDTTVEIVGHRAAEGYVISVTDQGIGMSAEQLAEANTQLSRPPLVGLSLSRSLGFIVIGRLAQRFNISVKLTASPSGGVTALVTLPAAIVEFAEGDEGAPTLPKAEPEVAVTVTKEEPPAPEPEPAIDEVAFLDEVSDEDFDRGLQSLVSGDVPPAPPEPEPLVARVVEPPPAPEPEPTPPPAPEPVVAAAPEPVSIVAEPAAPAPVAEAPAAPSITAAGLVQRTPKKRVAEPLSSLRPDARSSGQTQRSPEEVRKMLSRYRAGLNRGRTNDDGSPMDA